MKTIMMTKEGTQSKGNLGKLCILKKTLARIRRPNVRQEMGKGAKTYVGNCLMYQGTNYTVATSTISLGSKSSNTKLQLHCCYEYHKFGK